MDYTKALFGSKVLLACMLATQLGGGKRSLCRNRIESRENKCSDC